jgi:hypothetical protein
MKPSRILPLLYFILSIEREIDESTLVLKNVVLWFEDRPVTKVAVLHLTSRWVYRDKLR